MNDFWLQISTRFHNAWEKTSPWIYAVLIVAVSALILNGAL